MIVGLIKLIIWVAGVGVIAYFALPYFGYEINLDYFKMSRKQCEERLKVCQRELIQSGLEGVKDRCDWKCADFKLFLRKPTN